MLAMGIIMGLAAAAAQSVSYLCSRWYTADADTPPGSGPRHRGTLRLLVIGHVLQAGICLPLAWLLWPDNLPPLAAFGPELVGVAGCYLAGQVGLFIALRHTQASRVSPLLGLKIAILAILTVTLLGDTLAPAQWAAVAIAVAAAFVLNRAGGPLPWRAAAAIVFTCAGYCLSDFFIRLMIHDMRPVEPLHAAVFGAAMSYLLCGAALAAWLPWYGSRRPRDWAAAAPYAVSWLGAMFLLYACFAAVGIVLGNILQSTRGPISIALGEGLSRRGMVHLEARVPASVLGRRLAAAAMMMAAIVLFVVAR